MFGQTTTLSQPPKQQFTSGGFSSFQRTSQLDNAQAAKAVGDATMPSNSIAMRILQQKKARETAQAEQAPKTASDMNLYAPNPFGALQAPVAVSSGESD